MSDFVVSSSSSGAELLSTDLAALSFGGLSHVQMASKVRMLRRDDTDFDGVLAGARDRIMWLTQRVAQLEAQLAPADPPAAAGPAFRVFIKKMTESSRVTYWTTIVRSDRSEEAREWDSEGRIHPYMSEKLWQAEHEAAAWADLLGVLAEPFSEMDDEIDPAQRFPQVSIDYTNYRGERGIRKIQPINIEFGHTEFHPMDQWLLRARDVEKNADRTFALRDIHVWDLLASVPPGADA